jgi:hypothetical protein
MSRFFLYTTYYQEPNQARRAELDECLKRNLASGLFDAVCVLSEGDRPDIPLYWMETECQLKKQPRRQTFHDLFQWARENADDETISVVSNSDVYFDDSLLLVETQDMNQKCFALSRWDVGEDGSSSHWVAIDSQDCFIFKGKIPPIRADFCPGIPGVDNRLCYEIDLAGLEVSNPSRSIRAHHLHKSQVRNYDDSMKIPGPYLLVEPIYLPMD